MKIWILKNCQQIKKDGADADAEPKTLRELAKLPTAEQVKKDASAEQAEDKAFDDDVFDFAYFAYDEDDVKGITGMAEDGKGT